MNTSCCGAGKTDNLITIHSGISCVYVCGVCVCVCVCAVCVCVCVCACVCVCVCVACACVFVCHSVCACMCIKCVKLAMYAAWKGELASRELTPPTLRRTMSLELGASDILLGSKSLSIKVGALSFS